MKHLASMMVRTVIALLCLALLSLALLTTFLTREVSQDQYAANLAQEEKSMDSLATLLDNSFINYLNVATQAASLKELRPVQLTENDPVAQLDARTYLQTLKVADRHIIDLCLYLQEEDFFVTSQASFSPDSFLTSFYSFSRLTSRQVYDLFREPGALLPAGSPFPYFRAVGTMQANLSGASISDALLILLPLPLWGQQHYATLGIFVQTDDIRRQLSIAAGSGGARIVDRTGNTLIAVGEDQLPQGFQTGEDVRVFRRTSSRFGLTYESYIREESLARTNLNANNIALALVLLAMVATLISLLFARWVNRPIHQLMAHIGGSGKFLPDESAYIRQYIFQLGRHVEQNERYVDELLVRRLMAGRELSPAEYARCESLLQGDYAHCTAMMVRLNHGSEQALALTSVDCEHALIHMLQESAPETLLCVLACDDSTEALLPMVEQLRTRAPFRDASIITLGPLGDDISQLRKSMLRAENRMREMLYQGRTGVELADRHYDKRLSYPAEAMHHLSAASLSHDADGMRASCEEICQALLDEQMSPETGAMVVCDAAMLFPELADRVSASAQDFCQELRACVERLAQTYQQEQPGGADHLAQEIAQDIDQMLEQPGFGISTMSGKYGLSDSAFSHMFKRTFGVTFITYVNQRKIQRAKEMLEDSSVSLEVVASRLGYSSASNFTRMFKSYEGITPGAFRQLHRPGREETSEN